MEHIANPTDEVLQDTVGAALRTVLGHDAPHIGVSTDHGTVTLTGQLPTDAQRQAAHAATLEVWGVHSVADDIVVRVAHSAGETDTELAHAAQKALQHTPDLPIDAIVPEVRDHVVTLTGTVSSPAERLAAERAVVSLPGLARIENRVTVTG